MNHLTRSVLRPLVIGGLVLAVGALAAASWHSAWGQGTATMTVVGAPSSVSAGGPNFDVEIRIEGAQNLGTYEWQIRYDPNVVQLTQPAKSAISDGGFLGSTGRAVSCPPPILPPGRDQDGDTIVQPPLDIVVPAGDVRFGCATSLLTPPGPSGSGLLSTVKFSPLASGSPNIRFVCAALGDPNGDPLPLTNVPECGTAITPTPGPGQTPAPTSTPVPGAATPTPTGPLPTPTPLPPGLEAVGLLTGCNPVASTYPDGTPIGTIADRVGRAGILTSIWKFSLGAWLGYSPQFPHVSDLSEVYFLDAVFICVNSPGDFVRPIV